MTNYKLKKGAKVGELSAEHDRVLLKTFVDNGILEILLITTPASL